FLNGLYAAFNHVLKKHGGYLNKIEGDSIMFHYGGPIDPNIKGMKEKDALRYIARELFYTCIELQRVCHLFNQANESVLQNVEDSGDIGPIREAYNLVDSLRNNSDLAIAMNALFQIRIRVGASLGNVIIGNFGPQGARQWDVIGVPVIDAKRMETSSPAGGLRISSKYYDILKEIGILEDYFKRFRREALVMGSGYKNISIDEVFKSSPVQIKGKKVSQYDTYSVQVNPSLPEDTVKQLQFLLSKGPYGVERIIEILQYYRGNIYVISKVEKLFKKMNIQIRRGRLLKLIQPDLYKQEIASLATPDEMVSHFEKKYSLFNLLEILGKLQDALRLRNDQEVERPFIEYNDFMDIQEQRAQSWFDNNRSPTFKTYYYYNVIYPLFFSHLQGSMLEYQATLDKVEEL
ncbi:MAG: adenylate/guanylate cyclase domain-containing protein, partial [Spirochaetaceae bacterium]|nr:adenylate/guanylate cyclase domain-containing protein [Spirochaetaceae bacterium]